MLRHIPAPSTSWRRVAIGFTCTLLVALAGGSDSALAAAPWWHLSASAMPTSLDPGAEGEIVLRATNLGDASVNGAESPVTVTSTLPAGFVLHGISGRAGIIGAAGAVECSESTLACTFTGTLNPYEQLEVVLTVSGASSGAGQYAATVTGGGASATHVERTIRVSSAPVPFGIETFEMRPENEGGTAAVQAGAHPFQITTALALNQTVDSLKPPAIVRNLQVKLPPGLLGNPNAVPRCTDAQFTATQNFINECPTDSQIGVASVTVNEPVTLHLQTIPVPVFNLSPSRGEPARFGMEALNVPVIFDTSIRSGGDYGIDLSVDNIDQSAALLSSEVTLWGVPGDPRHDQSRGWKCVWAILLGEGCTAPPQHNLQPFISLPTACEGQLTASASSLSWPTRQSPNGVAPPPVEYAFHDDLGRPFELTGCNRLPFSPSMELVPASHATSTPTGVTVSVHVPQDTTLTAADLAESNLRDTTLTLPNGMQINPAGAAGLESCSTAQAGYTGMDGGTASFSPDAAACPDASKVGVVEEIKSPFLSRPLTGAVYLAAQDANPFGSLIALYLVAEDPVSGVRVKLAGNVALDAQTGQLTATFANTPQVPFEELKVHFFEGSHAPLSTPPYCGTYTTAASFTPWSGNAPATPSSSFDIDAGPNGSPCPTRLPFSPSMTAGSTNIQAAAFTPFTTTLSREDGNENLAGVTLHMPPGLLGKLASVTPCQEPQAAQGTCGSGSLIGHTVASVGLGSDPYTISGGQVFITGPYKGAPYGLSIAQPAKAGPFDLGSGACDCVVVRAKIEIDPHTSALTIVSDPLPTILQGIPVQLKHVNVTVDRPGFTFNPTNCSQLAIAATLTGEKGATAPLSVPFEVANCATLPFKPKLKLSLKGATRRSGHPALKAVVTYPKKGAYANIAKAAVTLPASEFIDNARIGDVCTRPQFAAGKCPPSSVLGKARAFTPLLDKPLEGPVYFRSNGGERELPDIVVDLHGQVHLVLVGFVDSVHKKGSEVSRIRNTFAQVPDAPVSKFVLELNSGKKKGLLVNSANLCKVPNKAVVKLTAQNGKTYDTNPAVANDCGKGKGKKSKRLGTSHR